MSGILVIADGLRFDRLYEVRVRSTGELVGFVLSPPGVFPLGKHLLSQEGLRYVSVDVKGVELCLVRVPPEVQ